MRRFAMAGLAAGLILGACGLQERNSKVGNPPVNAKMGCLAFKSKRIKLEYELTGKDAVMGGDTILPRDMTVPCENNNGVGLARTFETLRIWKDRRVPYTVPNGFPYTSELNYAIAEWRKAGLNWEPKIDTDVDYVNFVFLPESDNANCGTSSLGRVQGPQNLSLRTLASLGTCGPIMKYVLLHEMGHALGFMHEHQRSDRDNFVRFVGDVSNAQWLKKIEGTVHETPFDLLSVMMYGSGNTNPRMVTINGTEIPLNYKLSDNDIKGAKQLYNMENKAPVMAPMAPRTAMEDQASSFFIDASDVDSELSCTSANFSYTSSNPAVIPSTGGVTWNGKWRQFGNAGCSADTCCYAAVFPAPNASGTSNLTFTISDGFLTASQTFTVTITPSNDAPVISFIAGQKALINQEKIVAFTINDVDSTLSCSSSHLSYTSSDSSIVDNAGNAVSWSGTWPACEAKIRPVANAIGTTTITLNVTDGSLSARSSFLLTFEKMNTPPTINVISSQTTNEDVAKPISFVVGDDDGPLDCTPRSLSYTSSNRSLVSATGAITWSGTWPNCNALVTPVANAFGTTTLTFSLSDGRLTASRSFNFTVTSVNDVPAIAAISPQQTDEDIMVNIPVSVADADGALGCTQTYLSYTSSNVMLVPAVAAVTWSGIWPNCNARVIPATNVFGTVSLQFTVSDGTASASRSFDLTVREVNDAPTIAAIPAQFGAVGKEFDIPLTVADVDNQLTCSADFLSYTSSQSTVVSPNGGVTWSGAWPNCIARIVPSVNLSGTSTLTFRVSDGNASASTSFDVTSTPLPAISSMQSEAFLLVGNIVEVPLSIVNLNDQLPCKDALTISSDNAAIEEALQILITGTVGQCVVTFSPTKTSVVGDAQLEMTVKNNLGQTSRKMRVNLRTIRPDFLMSTRQAVAPIWIDLSASPTLASPETSIVEWEWDFGDGTNGRAKHFSKSYTAAGKYDVRLKVRNNLGQSESIIIPLMITDK